MYREENLVRIAKRENNNKRNYIVVNQLQGKHIKVSPTKALDMFYCLADILKSEYENEKLLLIGFAETATAIGAAAAVSMGTLYMQTTRESIENVEYLYFSEEHSHATEQRLVKEDLDAAINIVDRIVFIEDEITTGNTIMNIIKIIKKQYGENIKFSVASILNGMNSEYQALYSSHNINTHYLVKTNHDSYIKRANEISENGQYVLVNTQGADISFKLNEIHGYIDARRLVNGASYLKACELLWKNACAALENPSGKKILVLGTEEFMYPAIFIGQKLEESGNTVYCHSTTRSPIAVNNDGDYPLGTRYELVSLYDERRQTFIYDLDRYDRVVIVTDAGCFKAGVNSLLNAVSSFGNTDVSLIRWCLR